MAVLNRFSTILLYCIRLTFCFLLRNLWRFRACDAGNRAIRDAQFCAAKFKASAGDFAPKNVFVLEVISSSPQKPFKTSLLDLYYFMFLGLCLGYFQQIVLK